MKMTKTTRTSERPCTVLLDRESDLYEKYQICYIWSRSIDQSWRQLIQDSTLEFYLKGDGNVSKLLLIQWLPARTFRLSYNFSPWRRATLIDDEMFQFASQYAPVYTHIFKIAGPWCIINGKVSQRNLIARCHGLLGIGNVWFSQWMSLRVTDHCASRKVSLRHPWNPNEIFELTASRHSEQSRTEKSGGFDL